MRYLHSMVRVSNLEESLDFYCNKLGMIEVKRSHSEQGKFTLIFLAAKGDQETATNALTPCLELTYNWNSEKYQGGRNFGHLAYSVKNIYQTCQQLIDNGVNINRPPRDGYMAFIRSPDGISIELLQEGEPLETCEPWSSMTNQGEW